MEIGGIFYARKLGLFGQKKRAEFHLPAFDRSSPLPYQNLKVLVLLAVEKYK